MSWAEEHLEINSIVGGSHQRFNRWWWWVTSQWDVTWPMMSRTSSTITTAYYTTDIRHALTQFLIESDSAALLSPYKHCLLHKMSRCFISVRIIYIECLKFECEDHLYVVLGTSQVAANQVNAKDLNLQARSAEVIRQNMQKSLSRASQRQREAEAKKNNNTNNLTNRYAS